MQMGLANQGLPWTGAVSVPPEFHDQERKPGPCWPGEWGAVLGRPGGLPRVQAERRNAGESCQQQRFKGQSREASLVSGRGSHPEDTWGAHSLCGLLLAGTAHLCDHITPTFGIPTPRHPTSQAGCVTSAFFPGGWGW